MTRRSHAKPAPFADIKRAVMPHRVWMSLFAGSVFLWMISAPLLSALQANLSHRMLEAKNETARLEAEIAHLRADAEKTQKLAGSLSEEKAAQIMAVPDRAQTLATIDPLAAAVPLSHLTYQLSPPVGTGAPQHEAKDPDISESALTLSAKAPDDRTALQFIRAVQAKFPGRLDLESVTLSRIGTVAVSADKDPDLFNLDVRATFRWYANSATTEAARP